MQEPTMILKRSGILIEIPIRKSDFIWPFPSVNGQQTDQSKALEFDKQAHKPAQFDLSTVEDAPL